MSRLRREGRAISGHAGARERSERKNGDDCSYWGCMPSKALLRPTELLAAVRRVPAAATAVTGVVDVAAVLRRRDAFTSSWDDAGQVAWLEDAGIDLLRGHGRLAGERRVEVTAEDGSVNALEASRGIVLAVGTRASLPPIEGLDEVARWDNRDATAVEEIPTRLLVLGGGVIGVELGQAIRRLGADEVTIIEAQERLEDGRELRGDELLVAVGREALTRDLGLATVGVEPGRGGFVEVDAHLRVPGHEWLYVVGDANGRALLTHQGKYQARLVGDALAGIDVDPAWADREALPRVVFTDPQIAAVGRTEAAAEEAGFDVLTVRADVGGTAGGALTGDEVGGTAQLVIDRDRRVLLGATFVGPGVAELLHAATVAIVSEVTLDRLWHAVPAFPTVSEVWLRLLEEVRAEDLRG